MRKRREFSRAIKRGAWDRCQDSEGVARCELCTAPLTVGKYRFDHTQPDAFAGEPTLENCKVLCSNCDYAKTYQRDLPAIRKADRVFDRFIGATPPTEFPLQGGREDRLKRKINGRVVLRATGEPWRPGSVSC